MSEDENLSPLWDDLLKDHEAETPLGEVALFRGYVTPDQLEECLQEQERLTTSGESRPIGEILFSKGFLELKQFAEVLQVKRIRVHYCEPCHEIYDSSRHNSQVTIRCHKCGDDAKSVGEGDLPVSQVDIAILAGEGIPSGARIGKYQIRKKIGEGGMGVIYEAEDPDLERTVALKVFKGQTSNRKGVSRLHREAALAARLRHPNIIAVHEVATCSLSSGEPMHYISMDYIEGLTFGRYQKKNRDLPLRERLLILEKVSRAIHYAHTRGVVHRDLKPENILIDQKGAPIVMDFGLAKDIDGLTKLTVSGAVMGTPMYMSPEQAGGKTREISPLTDVYALGVMMYEIITGGIMPFDADTPAAIYKKILEDDPPHPRMKKKNIHGDLSVICLKALEKKQADRYESALAFAEDLARFLAGDPIEARSPGMVTRIGRKVAKRKAIFGVGAAGVLVVAAVLGFMIPKLLAERSRTVEEERKRVAAEEARLSLLREKTSMLLSAMLKIRRAGSTEGVDEYRESVKKACDEVISEFPNLAEPHYILGRMYRAGMEPKEALREQNLAIKFDPGYASAHYERVILEIQEYQDAFREATGAGRRKSLLNKIIGISRQPEASIPLDVQKKRERLEERLRDLESLVHKNPKAISEGRIACARGLWLWITGDFAGAREALLLGVNTEEVLEEAYEALATLEMEVENFEESIRWWTRGIKVDKGYVPHLEGRGFTYILWAKELEVTGEDSVEQFGLAIDDFTEALSRRPTSETRLERGQAIVELANFLLSRAPEGTTLESKYFQDCMDRFAAGISDLDQVVLDRPGWVEVWISRGLAHGNMTLYLHRDSDFESAISDLEVAFQLDPDRIDVRILRGKLYLDAANGFLIKNPKYDLFYGQSLDNFRKAIAQNENLAEAWHWKAFCLTQYGKFLKKDRRNPIPVWEEAKDDYARVISLLPSGGEGFIRRGGLLNHIAEYVVEMSKGDPLPIWAEAEADFSRGIELEPNNHVGPWLRGYTYFGRAKYSLNTGGDGTEDFRKALRDFEDASERSSDLKRKLADNIEKCREFLHKSPE